MDSVRGGGGASEALLRGSPNTGPFLDTYIEEFPVGGWRGEAKLRFFAARQHQLRQIPLLRTPGSRSETWLGGGSELSLFLRQPS